MLTRERVGRGVNPAQNVGDVLCMGSGAQKSPSGVQGRSPGRGSGGRSPPEAEAILEFYMHNSDLILSNFPHSKFWGTCPLSPRFTPLRVGYTTFSITQQHINTQKHSSIDALFNICNHINLTIIN